MQQRVDSVRLFIFPGPSCVPLFLLLAVGTFCFASAARHAPAETKKFARRRRAPLVAGPLWWLASVAMRVCGGYVPWPSLEKLFSGWTLCLGPVVSTLRPPAAPSTVQSRWLAGESVRHACPHARDAFPRGRIHPLACWPTFLPVDLLERARPFHVPA